MFANIKNDTLHSFEDHAFTRSSASKVLKNNAPVHYVPSDAPQMCHYKSCLSCPYLSMDSYAGVKENFCMDCALRFVVRKDKGGDH